MRRHLVLFVRAPALGHGKRRLARAIGDVAALGFERLMIARLLRRLGNDRRWQLRIALTPDHACRGPGSGGAGSKSFLRGAAIWAGGCGARSPRPRPVRWC